MLYGLGFALLILAYWRKEWTPAPYPETGSGTDTLRSPVDTAHPGDHLVVAAFLTLGNNLFTLLNVTLWVLAIIFFVWAFWLPDENHPAIWARLKTF